MMNIAIPSHLIGSVICGIFLTSILLTVMQTKRYTPKLRYLMLIILVGFSAIPINGLYISEYAASIFGELSITTALLSLLLIISQLTNKRLISTTNFNSLFILVLFAALFLYPCSMGLCYFDPYILGYQPKWLLTFLFFIAVVGSLLGFYLVSACIIIITATYSISLYSSNNLWDYLIDPLISIFALFYLLTSLIKYIINIFNHHPVEE